jgi:hypothetical protein
MNQRKCPQCGTWNEGKEKTCTVCGAVIDEEVIREENKKRMTQSDDYRAELAQRLKEQPDWLNRFFAKLQASKNPFSKGLYYFLNTLWMVYFGILLGVAWLVFTVAS